MLWSAADIAPRLPLLLLLYYSSRDISPLIVILHHGLHIYHPDPRGPLRNNMEQNNQGTKDGVTAAVDDTKQWAEGKEVVEERKRWDGAVDDFDDMDLKEDLLRGIYAFGFERPSAIQQQAIMPCIAGKYFVVIIRRTSSNMMHHRLTFLITHPWN